jgi:hypothetical protein
MHSPNLTKSYEPLYSYTTSDNKVRELATMYLPWQQWTETPQYGLKMLAYQRFTAVLSLISGILFLSLLLSECATARISELELEHCL